MAEVALDGVSALSVAGTDHYWREFLPEGATRDHEAARVCGEGVELADALAMPPGGFHRKGWPQLAMPPAVSTSSAADMLARLPKLT